METQTDTPQHKILVSLRNSGCPYALIRNGGLWRDAGDIDIIVSDIDCIAIFLESVDFCEFTSKNGNRKYLKYDVHSGWWIHLDVQFKLFFGDIEAPNEFKEAVLSCAESDEKGIFRLHPSDELILLIFHLALQKGEFGEKYRNDILNADIETLEKRSSLYNFLPAPLNEYLQIIKKYQSGEYSELLAINQIQSLSSFKRSYKKPLVQRILIRLNKIRNINNSIVFLGPDGSGKSTITEALSHLRWPSLKVQYMGPARESEMMPLFNILLSCFDKFRNNYSKQNIIGILSRILWQVTCYFDFLTRIYRHIWFCGSDGVVLFDRYACDMFFRKPTRINELLFLKLFPKPNFVFLCVGNSEQIYNRKPEELSINDIQNTINLYRSKLIEYRISFLEIDTTVLTKERMIESTCEFLVKHNWFRT